MTQIWSRCKKKYMKKKEKIDLCVDTYSKCYHLIFPVEQLFASKTTTVVVHLKTVHSILFFRFSSSSPSLLSLKNNHNSLISISRLLTILLFFFCSFVFSLFSLSLSPLLSSPIYLFNQSSLLLLLSEND